MTNKPKISIIGPSHRTHLWQSFFASIITNLDFEVIFVTDKEPKPEEIPNSPSFRWILSPVKPAQCFEIGYRQSTGDYIIWTGDDFTYAPYALDNLYAMQKSFYDHKVMISCDVYEDGVEQTKRVHVIPWNEKIQLTTSALISKQAIEEVGGLADINFVCGHWDSDLVMRIYANGGRMFICPNALGYEPHMAFHAVEANFGLDWAKELEYFTHLWKEATTSDGVVLNKRKEPFLGYANENILTISQGNKGSKWK